MLTIVDEVVIRDEIINILVAARDTASARLLWMFCRSDWLLDRRDLDICCVHVGG